MNNNKTIFLPPDGTFFYKPADAADWRRQYKQYGETIQQSMVAYRRK